MPARPLMPTGQRQAAPSLQHAQFQPSATEQLVGQVKGQVINQGINKAMPMVETAVTNAAAPLTNAMGLTTAAAPAAAAAPLAGAAAAPLAAAAPFAGAAGAGAAGAGAAGAGAAGAAGAGGMLAGLGGAGAAAAPMLAAAAPVALPLMAAAGAAKLFGLFNEGGRVPSETMTAMEQPAPQQGMAPTQAGGPLSFKHAEQQQKLALKQATFDADQKRKEEAHRIKMMQQQQKLTEAASGFQTPLSAR
jgi:ABC-type multidrug transport system fused ATPase/permease subunit